MLIQINLGLVLCCFVGQDGRSKIAEGNEWSNGRRFGEILKLDDEHEVKM
jgi:hypothetical protein